MTVTLKNFVLAITGGVLVTLTAQAGACDRGGFRAVYRPLVNPYQTMYQRPVVQQPIQPQLQPWMQPGLQGPNSGVTVTIQGQTQAGGASATAISALDGTASTALQQQNIGLPQQNAGAQQAQVGGAAPQTGSGFVQTGGGSAQQNVAFNQPTGNVAPQGGNLAPTNPASGAAPASPSQATEKSAQTLALEALMGTGGSEQASASQVQAPQASGPTGNFTAQVSSGTTVRLSLNKDGSFLWTATKDGKASNFQGNYTLSGNSLTLLRSDSQKLEGTLTPKAGGFNLKLAGQNGGDLSFAGG